MDIPHISSYALTVEPKTALNKFIQTGKIAEPNDEVAQEHFVILVETLKKMISYIMNCLILGKKIIFPKIIRLIGWGKNTIGIGPSAHSYDGISRSWNVSNNTLLFKINSRKQTSIVKSKFYR